MNYTVKIYEKAAARLKYVRGGIIAGFSGGADSTALLCVLIGLFGKENVTAVHINHMLRGKDADDDEAFCRRFAEKTGVGFICEKINVRALCGDSSVEETARNVRYEVFARTAEKIGAKYVALAHTASDNLETTLFNMCRGSGIAGMRGIPFSRPCGNALIIRPLIDCTKEEILGFISENGLSHVTDKTNSDTHYTRNFIRANIVPQIKTIFPQAEKSVGAMCDSLSLDYDYMEHEADKFISDCASDGKPSLYNLTKLHPAILRRALAKLSPVSLDYLHICEIEAMIVSGSEGKISVPGDVFAVCSDRRFFFGKSGDVPERPEFEMKLSIGVNVSPLGFCICVGGGEAPRNFELAGEAEIGISSLPRLKARSRRTGDKYFFWKMTRTIKKMLSGLPEKAKMIRPVVCDGDNVIWYPGFPPTPCGETKKIKLRYYESEESESI